MLPDYSEADQAERPIEPQTTAALVAVRRPRQKSVPRNLG